MKCPECRAEGPDGAPECPACGVIFAKLKEKKEAERRAAEELLARAAEPPKPVNPWVGRLLALGVVTAWLSGMAVYYILHMAQIRRQAEETPSIPGLPPRP